MKLKAIYLENFGPFKEYEINFPTESRSCILITGKNNAGKTTIIRSLKMIAGALKFARSSVRPITKRLFKRDMPDINLERLMYQFKASKAIIQATFDNEKIVKITLNNSDGTITCELPPYAHTSMSNLFGFLPPLGQLIEQEKLLTQEHLLKYINSTLAPHHLRNHLYHFFDTQQYNNIREIVKETWEGVKLHDCEFDLQSGLLFCTYEEGRFLNEIAWSGQGFQIWLQIITHLVRLSEHPLLILDEPEIYLHPQKQHDLIRLLQEHYSGCSIIATHSTELMNDVDISHIIHVQRDTIQSITRKTSDRNALEKIRRQIGSDFNFHASQFEDVELLLATEYQIDFEIIQQLASLCSIGKKMQNIKLSGFSHWKDAIHYREAYHTYFSRKVDCSILLDRDFYPNDYLDSIKKELLSLGLKITYTPGKEIENIFLDEDFLVSLLPIDSDPSILHEFCDHIYEKEYETCKSKYTEFVKDYSTQNKHKTYSTIQAEISPSFNKTWNDKKLRYLLIPGKNMLAEVRDFFRTNYRINLTTSFLSSELFSKRLSFVKEFLSSIF